MTRKDFEALAGVIRDEYAHTKTLFEIGHIDLDQRVERDLATMGMRGRMEKVFIAANPRFDVERFRAACQYS